MSDENTRFSLGGDGKPAWYTPTAQTLFPRKKQTADSSSSSSSTRPNATVDTKADIKAALPAEEARPLKESTSTSMSRSEITLVESVGSIESDATFNLDLDLCQSQRANTDRDEPVNSHPHPQSGRDPHEREREITIEERVLQYQKLEKTTTQSDANSALVLQSEPTLSSDPFKAPNQSNSSKATNASKASNVFNRSNRSNAPNQPNQPNQYPLRRQASIERQVREIEDEESRRLTAIAFLV